MLFAILAALTISDPRFKSLQKRTQTYGLEEQYCSGELQRAYIKLEDCWILSIQHLFALHFMPQWEAQVSSWHRSS